MNTKILFPFVLAGILAGCATPQPSTAARGPYVKPGCIMLTADQAEARGIQVKPKQEASSESLPAGTQPLDASSVVVAGDVKVYTFGRMVDPADRDVMHEAHAVYRRESDPKWRLRAQPGQQVLIGPRVTDSNTAAAPVSQEVDSYLADQRRIAAEHRQAIEVLYRGMETLSKQQQQTQRLVVQYLENVSKEEAPKKEESSEKPEQEAPKSAGVGAAQAANTKG